MVKKRLLAVVAAGAAILGTLSSTVAQGNTLTIWADSERIPVLVALADEVEADLGVTLRFVEIGLGDARDQLLTAGPVGEGPDIMITAHDNIGQLVQNGAIVPIELDEDLRAQFTEAGLSLFTYQNELWGVPYAIENVALIRNVDIAPEPFATWDDVRALGEELKDQGIFPIALPTGDTYHNFPVISAFGGYIFGLNPDGTFNVMDIGLASEGGLAAAQWLSGMYRDGLLPTSVDMDVMFALFEEGKTASIVTGPWFSQRIIDTGVNYAIDRLPGVEGVSEFGAPFSGGQGFVISAFSNNQLLAETFLLDYVATIDFMQALFDSGGRPPVFVGVDTSAEPNIEGFVDAGFNAIPMPAIPQMSSVWGAAGSALTLISQGEEPVATMQNAVQQIITAIGIAEQLAAAGRTITLVGSLQSEAGCPGDWDPTCSVTFMTDNGDGTFTITITLPAGDYEYKVAVNGSWDENYGADGARGGANITLSLAAETEVTFTFDDNTKMISDSVNN